jgi:hypothetical protein
MPVTEISRHDGEFVSFPLASGPVSVAGVTTGGRVNVVLVTGMVRIGVGFGVLMTRDA